MLNTHGIRSNQDLAQDLDVSEMTIRRDLNELERGGQVKRVRGGVRGLQRADPASGQLAELPALAERAIAEAAADLVADGETLYLGAGDSPLALAQALRQRDLRDLRIVSNSVSVSALLAGGRWDIVQLGGEVRAGGAVVGQQAIRLIESMRFDRCFFCADGVKAEFGISGRHLAEIEVTRAAIQQSEWSGLLLEASGWDRQSMLRIAHLSDVRCILSDAAPAEPMAGTLRQSAVELIVAAP